MAAVVLWIFWPHFSLVDGNVLLPIIRVISTHPSFVKPEASALAQKNHHGNNRPESWTTEASSPVTLSETEAG